MTIATGDSVTLEYTGRLDDDTVFDTSRQSVAEKTGLAEAQPDREYAPLTVEIGDEQVIEGMEEGLIGLEAGATETLTIPPEKAYGERATTRFKRSKPRNSERCSAGKHLRKAPTSRRRTAAKAKSSTSTKRSSEWTSTRASPAKR